MIERNLLGTPIAIGAGVLSTAGARILARAPARTIAVITDETVAALPVTPMLEASIRSAAPGSRVIRREIPPGERQKSREQWAALTDWLLAETCGRDTTVIALGGGVVGDLAGFVAATYMRGVPVVQVPTTLVAMVDAAVGGKTGVDTPAGKNLVGAFHQPALVLVDPGVIATLPVAQVRAGLAEVLKHGAVADADYFHLAARHAADLANAAPDVAAAWWRGDAARDLVAGSIAIKARIVAADEREAGIREVLNFGHTVAHAIESVSGYTILHGHAVSIGMLAECVVGEAIGATAPGVAPALRTALGAAGLPVALPTPMDEARLARAMQVDKKTRGGGVRFSLPSRLGAVTPVDGKWSVGVSASFLRQAVRAIAAPAAPGQPR